MLPSEGVKPVVLLLGEVILAESEWNALTAIAELRVSHDHSYCWSIADKIA